MLGLRFFATAFSSCSERGPLFIAVRGPLTIAASPVAEHRLQTHRLSSCGSRAQLLRGMWDLPGPGLEPVSPALAGRLSTTAPPGKPSFMKHLLYISCIRYQEYIEDYYNSISMLYICPDEQDGRKIMPLGKKWLYCKWVVYTFNWTPKHFLLMLLSTSLSCIFSLSLFVLYFALLVVPFLSSMRCQLLSLCCLGQVSPTLKNDKNNIK